MGIRQDQCNKVCRIIDDYLANRPRERDELIVAVRTVFKEADRKTENSSEITNNCKYAENPSGDVWECGCFLDTYCEHQIYDRNPDGTINIVKCGYEPKDEPTTEDCSLVDKDINVRSKTEPQTCGNCYYYSDVGVKCCDHEHDPTTPTTEACEFYEPKTEPQFDKDINVRSKDEPTHSQHIQHVGSVETTWTKEDHEAFYTFLWNVINPNEMQDYIGMFETKDEPQTERSE